ncbi:MAG: TetR family transcriptional regulator [Lachnospiraceae bacterium]|nr:TetR family transcriptional regulator [Lachnospiraceae bacterium]
MRKKTSPQILASSLIELCETKPVDKITIKEIAENCGLSSQTFYNHFTDKYDLILWIHKKEGDELLRGMENGEYNFREMTIRNLKFYAEHANFMMNALSNTHGKDSYRVASAENAIEMMEGFIKRHFWLREIPEKERVLLRMFIYASTEIYGYWVFEGMKIPVETLAAYIVSAMPVELRKYFPEDELFQ